MVEIKVERRVLLREVSGEWAVRRHDFRVFDGGVLVGSFSVLIFDPVVLNGGISTSELEEVGCGGLGRMMSDIFGDIDRIEMLGYVSRQIGKLKPVKRIYWVENIRMHRNSATEDVVRAFVYGVEKRILKYRGILIFGLYDGVYNLFPILDGMGFRCIDGMDYRFVGKVDRRWVVRFEMYLPGF